MKRKKYFKSKWRSRLHEIIYEADTGLGKWFDIILIIAIIISILLVMLESVESIDAEYHDFLLTSEWIITVLFTLEYIARIVSIKRAKKYIFSFYGIIDFLATIPMYLSLFLVDAHALLALRALRLLRVFRILKLTRYLGARKTLINALRNSKLKIAVFLFSVIVLTIILGTIMYMIEGPENGFNNIPHSMYWAIVTLTTVGYGDVYPVTALGKIFAVISAFSSIGIVALPAGILAGSFTEKFKKKK